jgi:hypothetical protein
MHSFLVPSNQLNMSWSLVCLFLVILGQALAAPTLCTAPAITGNRENLATYVNVTFAAAPLTLEGGVFVGNWPGFCNSAFRITVEGTSRPYLFTDCYLTNSGTSLILPFFIGSPDDMESSTGYTFRITYTVDPVLSTTLKAGGVTQASFFCLTQDRMAPSWLQVVMANRSPWNSTYSAVFSEPVSLCNGAPSFTSTANISMVFTGTLYPQLNGLVWSLDIPYGSNTQFANNVEIWTNNLCDIAGNRLAVYGLPYPTRPWTIGHEPRVVSRQKDMISGIAKLYDTDDDGEPDILVYPNTLPLLTPSPSIQASNVVSQTQFLTNCVNDSWIPMTITCDVPSIFSFNLNFTLTSTENVTAPTAFSPYATMAVGVSSVQTQTHIRPLVVSATSQIGASYIDIGVLGGMVPLTATLVGGEAFLFYDPESILYPIGYTDETSNSARLLLSGPLDSTRFSSVAPVYVTMHPDYWIPGNLGPQWKLRALSFPDSSQAIQPLRIVLYFGRRLDIQFTNYTGVQLSLDYLYTTGLTFTCSSFSGPKIYNSTELRFNVTNCLNSTSLFFNATKAAIPLGDSYHLQALTNFPVEYQRYYPIVPTAVYLYDYRVLAIWVNQTEFSLNVSTLNTSAISISCGTLSGFDLSSAYLLRANVSGCAEGEEARVIIDTTHPLIVATDGFSSLISLNTTATLLGPANRIAATECFPTFNASLFRITHTDDTEWVPADGGIATVNCSNQTARILLKDGTDMFCAIDIEHEGLACVMTYRVLATQALVYETVTVTNLTSCSYRGPYVETAHVHGNSTLSIQMFTLSAITPDSVQDYKFNLTCDGVNATLSNTSQVLVQGTIVQLEVLSGCSENSTNITLSIQQEALETVHFETNLDPDRALASQARDMNFASSSCENYLHQLNVYSAFGWSLAHISDPNQCLNTTAYTEEAVLVTLKSKQAQDGKTGSVAECQLVATLKGGYAHTVQLPLTLSDKTCSFKQPTTGIFDLENGLLALFIIALALLLAGIFYLVLRFFMVMCKRIESAK